VNDQVLRLLQRIKASGDGEAFLLYLETLSFDNYRAWKKDHHEMNEFHKGYAFAIDSLSDAFKSCEDMLNLLQKTDVPHANEHY
jgi:hypothetical protein